VQEARALASRILGDNNADRGDRFIAAATLFVSAAAKGPDRRKTMIELIPPLERILHEERQDYWRDHDTEMCITRLLAFALGEVERTAEAAELLTDAIGRFPSDTTLRTARAFVNFEINPTAARSDFRTAVDQGTKFVTPYMGLAWFMLNESDYASLLQLCDQALCLEIDSRQNRAWLVEWRGIALAETGGERDRVEEEFSLAADLAPNRIEQIQANRTLAILRMQSGKKPNASWRLPSLPGLKEAAVERITKPPTEGYTPEMALLS
jgi:tetratricopeptide (TPR) repeat protein